jgi:hypothetical protein
MLYRVTWRSTRARRPAEHVVVAVGAATPAGYATEGTVLGLNPGAVPDGSGSGADATWGADADLVGFDADATGPDDSGSLADSGVADSSVLTCCYGCVRERRGEFTERSGWIAIP